MEIKFFNLVEQDSIDDWFWILPCLSYIKFRQEISGLYFSWLKWDIISIEWPTHDN